MTATDPTITVPEDQAQFRNKFRAHLTGSQVTGSQVTGSKWPDPK